MLTGYWS